MNELNAPSKETKTHVHPLPGKIKEGCPGAGRLGVELEPRPRSQSTLPSPRRAAFPAHPPPGPLGCSLPALSWGSRPSQPEALAPGPGSARGRSWLPQPPPAEAPAKFARGSSPILPRPHQASRSPGRSRGCRLRGRSRRRCSTGRARAAEKGSVRAEGGAMAAETNYHQLRGLKQEKFVGSQSRRPHIQNQGVSSTGFP